MTAEVLAYRLTNSITAAVRNGNREKLQSLKAGSVLIPTSEPDRAGMVQATWGDLPVLVFRRDLEECSECVEIESGAPVSR